jgi:hypothetical protein
MARSPRIAAIAVSAALVLGACGKGGGGDGVASLSGGGSTTTTVKGKKASQQDMRDALLGYTRCLRKHGVQVADPTFGSSGPSGNGGLSAGAAAGNGPQAVIANPAGSITLPSPDDPAFKKADKVCQPILRRSQQDLPQPSAEEQAKARDHALAFAKCMREHGVDMPDPKFDGEGHVAIQIPGPKGKDPRSPLPQNVQDAQKACQSLMDLPGGGPGGGPSTQSVG